jgi:hypothetical protein
MWMWVFFSITRKQIMAKPKLSLTPNPTFKAVVGIPVPGAKPVDVEFTFKGRTREAFKLFTDGLVNRDDTDVLMDIISGWDLEDTFDKDNVEKLTQAYIGAARAIIEKYLTEITAARLGN